MTSGWPTPREGPRRTESCAHRHRPPCDGRTVPDGTKVRAGVVPRSHSDIPRSDRYWWGTASPVRAPAIPLARSTATSPGNVRPASALVDVRPKSYGRGFASMVSQLVDVRADRRQQRRRGIVALLAAVSL